MIKWIWLVYLSIVCLIATYIVEGLILWAFLGGIPVGAGVLFFSFLTVKSYKERI